MLELDVPTIDTQVAEHVRAALVGRPEVVDLVHIDSGPFHPAGPNGATWTIHVRLAAPRGRHRHFTATGGHGEGLDGALDRLRAGFGPWLASDRSEGA